MRFKGICNIETVNETFKVFTRKPCDKINMDMHIIETYKLSYVFNKLSGICFAVDYFQRFFIERLHTYFKLNGTAWH